VPDRLLVDLSADGQVTVVVWPEAGTPETVGQMPLAWPLNEREGEDIRWYLEDYLRAPFGVWEDRGPWVAGQLTAWGEAIFASVLGSGLARDAYLRFRDRPAELVFRSAVPALLGLPWELICGPAGPLALGMAGVSRSLPDADLAWTAEVPGRRLRVLMVISRPAGAGDVGYRMIARPLLERLAAVRGAVDLVVLRPPTFEALRMALAEAVDTGDPFHIVHFDGHGEMPRPGTGRSESDRRTRATRGASLEGELAFELPGGGSDFVPASKIAAALVRGQVPVVVLNACQSGAIGKELEATVATRLLQEGAAAVVAMAYRVYAVAAAEFMAVFYERLFAGDTVSAAVTAGRRRLFERDRRPSPKGEVPLADWSVPVHYMHADVRFPQARTGRAAPAQSLDAALDRLQAPAAPRNGQARSLDPAGSFVGRDDLFYELEKAMTTLRVVVLHGPGGAGKTELARAFGRWWRDTGGTDQPDWVVWHSFEPGAESFSLDGVITTAGVQVFGAGFANLPRTERHRVAEELLATQRLFLIWDNFETVRSMPDPAGATAPLDEADSAELKDFLARLACECKSAVVIVSRTAEDWLGPVQRISVGGLHREEAAQYAGQLLASCPGAGPRRAQRAFGELLEWLDGNPLSMRLILPRLETAGPETLLAGLRGVIPLPAEPESGGDRDTSLAASISYSFAHVADKTRRLLLAVCLFHGTVSTGVLAVFSGTDGAPERFAGAGVQEWAQALDDAARVGLLTVLGSGMYRVHPALPAYLSALWRAEDPDGYGGVRDGAARALVSAYGQFAVYLGQMIESRDAGFAFEVIGMQRREIAAALIYALEQRLWDQACDITHLLNYYWEARGLDEQADPWADQVRAVTEDPDGTPPPPDSPAGQLWLTVVGAQADRHRAGMRLDEAERAYQKILDTLQAHASPAQRFALTAAQEGLGTIAHVRGRFKDAEDWYRKSLATHYELGDQRGVAASYHQLGILAGSQDRPEEAEDWYRKSLAIHCELGDQRGVAASCHQLGNVYHMLGRLDAAQSWCTRSLMIYQELDDRPHMALNLRLLGMIAQDQGRLDDAEARYRKSIAVHEELGKRPDMARDYHQFGRLAELRGQTGEAEGWYRKSLAISEDLGDRSATAFSCYAIGNIARRSGRLKEAEDCYLRSLAIFEELGNRLDMAASYYQLGMVAQLRERLEIAEHWYRRSLAIFEELGDQSRVALSYRQLGSLAEKRCQNRNALEWTIRGLAFSEDFSDPSTGPELQALARLTAELGSGVLEQSWREITGNALPNDIRQLIGSSDSGHEEQEQG
jgi:tetratricopeptide (TPR) repeat protein